MGFFIPPRRKTDTELIEQAAALARAIAWYQAHPAGGEVVIDNNSHYLDPPAVASRLVELQAELEKITPDLLDRAKSRMSKRSE